VFTAPNARLVPLVALGLLFSMAAPGLSQPPRPKVDEKADPKLAFDIFQSISKPGPMTAELGVAQIQVPEGYRFIPKENMKTWADLTGNLHNPHRNGVVYPADNGDPWLLIFSYSDDGYIKDDEKGELDANALFKALTENQAEANKQLQREKKEQLFLVRWEKPPFYDSNTNNLTWALRTRVERGAEGINYQSRLLGRGGFMSATLVCSPEELTATIPTYDKLLTGFSYRDGQKYSDWRSGDKVAAYGLGGLVLGGAGVWAAKSGILAKFGKVIFGGIAAVVAAIGAFFKKVFGRGSETA
jgi:uncharacterized membrane-anchored protein